ncbi:MAG: NAD-dependent epimerase/dehydratase family protein [Bacteroidales bacterium]|nr:NAD-dependent epimerase/dehydratase family protein [Bacteroidales bacterium]
MRVFVTGANGFLGCNLVRELLKRKHKVIAFVQYNQDITNIKDLNITIKYGDLLEPDSINKALLGCEALIHVAAVTYIWPYRSEIQKKINIEGTRNIMRAAIDNNIYRIIHVGTANSFGFGSKEKLGDEEKPYMAGKYKMDYMDTKYAAQQVVLEMTKSQGLPAIVVNPTFMFGPYPSKLACAKMIYSIFKGKSPGYTKGGRNYIAVKDVCVGIVNALTKGKIGECYILGNKNLSYNEIFILIAKVTNTVPPKFFIPNFVVKLYGFILTQIARITFTEPLFSYRMAQMSCDDHYYSSAKAVKELELPQTPIEEAIKETFEWMKANNFMNCN